MKRIILSLIFTLCAYAANAMSYEEARQQAWFLTDKMAYELNLTSDQYDRAYQINLDYLMSVSSPNDCSGYYWQYRDTDLRCILFDWQYNLYRTLDYFFRPVRWYESRWYYPVFDHYRHGYYYFDRPNIYLSYTGGMWRRRSHNDPSPYIGLAPHRGLGMRDQYRNRSWFGGSDFRNGHNQPSPHPQANNRPWSGRGNNDRPNSNYHSSNSSPNNPVSNNNQPNNNRNNNSSTPYRDSYTNYRQTGNSTTPSVRGFGSNNRQINRGGATGVSSTNSNTGGRSTRGTSSSNSNNTNRNVGGRTFGR